MFIITFIALKDFISKKSSLRSAPGPWRLPIIGSRRHFINPEPHHRQAKRPCENIRSCYGRTTSLPEAAKVVLKFNDINLARRPQVLAADIVAYDCKDLVFSPFENYPWYISVKESLIV